MPRRKEPRIPDAILDQLLAGPDAKTAFDPNGLLDDLKKALAERVLNAEMDDHLAGEELGNRRNGYLRTKFLILPRQPVRARCAALDCRCCGDRRRGAPGPGHRLR